MKISALVPIKSHSSRVPGKNFRPLSGKPLCNYILNTLSSIESISEILVNTDAIPELTQANASAIDKVVFKQRKASICGDEISMNTVLSDDIETTDADIYLMTHTTNPLLSKETIKSALEYFLNNPASDSLFTVNKHQTRFYDAAATPINHDPSNLIPTQNLPPYFEENSCLYIFTKESFLSTNARIGLRPLMYEIPKIEAIDIDTSEDWDMAHYLLTGLQAS